MPAINFSAQFADAVASGEKTQTIRGRRKNPIKVGDKLKLFTGMRTKACRLLKTVICTKAAPVSIEADKYRYFGWGEWQEITDPDVLLEVAREDRFNSWIEMADWFDRHYRLPFVGVLISWR